uniref:C-JID domain-containing protein n=1 Tax=Populus alba TaxID=43335 RepID=A0A4U5QZ79_POPAL|nr:hypothetical protein D5086_0000021220 [Populus alba]
MQYGCSCKFKILLKLCFSFTGFQGTGKAEGIFLDVSKLRTENVEGMFLDVSEIREIELSSTAFARMYNLRLLKIYNSVAGDKCTVHLPCGLESLSHELRYLHWDGYPLASLPCNFRPQNLVELNLSSSKVKQLWRGDQLCDVPEGACSFCLPGDVIPEWFSHQSWGSTVTFQLSSHSANSEFLGFSLCAVIACCSIGHGLQVKCIYHFRNEHGDSHDLYCYLHGWYDEKRIDLAHIFVGFDPCLVAKKDYMFSEYSEVSVEFQPEDINGNLLPLDLCQVHECGVRLLYVDGIHQFDLIMQGYFRYYPLDRDGVEAMFQAKRARFQCMRWDDSFVMRWAYDQVSKGACSFCLPGDVIPDWFSHQWWGSTVTFQLFSRWANSEFLGFCLCAVVAFGSGSHSLQVKCTYHFRNEQGDSHDLHYYLHGWYDNKRIDSTHIFVGFDPCLVAKVDDIFNEYSEVSVEFQPEDMNGNLLPLDLCQVVECGVCLLDTDEMHSSDFIKKIIHFERTMPGYFRSYPLDRDGLEVMFQAKRERFQGIRWEDYSVRRRIVMDNYLESWPV